MKIHCHMFIGKEIIIFSDIEVEEQKFHNC